MLTQGQNIRLRYGRQTISLGPLLETKSKLVVVFPLGREDLVEKTRDGSRDPARTQCGSEGLRAADLKGVQCLQQHVAGMEVDQSVMACL